jgi:hypothetical protein
MRGKWLILWFALVLSALVVSACGSTGAESTPTPTVTEGEYCIDQNTGVKMSYQQAVEIAQGSECLAEGQLKDTRICNESTGTWWIDLDADKPGCAPACVVSLAEQRAVINWRCTGALPEPTPLTEVEDEVQAPDVLYEGISFSYSDAVASEVVPEIAPSEELRLGGVMPTHASFAFNGYPLADTLHEARVYVYPVQELKAGWGRAEEVVANLQQLLSARPATPESPLILPPTIVGKLISTQFSYVDFQNGAGVRFLTQANYGGLDPINNQDLFYTFQGLTSDGVYYVAAILPVSHPSLPASGLDIPGGDPTAFAADFDAYRVEIEQQLGAQPPSSFTPDLDALDAVIQSLEVVPTISWSGVLAEETQALPVTETVPLDETWTQYTNDDFGFSFQYPADWALEIVPSKALEGGGIWADAVVLHKDKMAISIQYMHTSSAEGVGWGGVGGGGPYDQATVGNKVTLIGQEAQKWVWTYNGGIKAIQVQAVSRDANLALTITLCDDSVVFVEDPAAETIPETAIGVLNQILSSFALTQ